MKLKEFCKKESKKTQRWKIRKKNTKKIGRSVQAVQDKKNNEYPNDRIIKKEKRKSSRKHFFKCLKIEEYEFIDRRDSLNECPILWMKIDSW